MARRMRLSSELATRMVITWIWPRLAQARPAGGFEVASRAHSSGGGACAVPDAGWRITT